jgi:hypothetical protein
MSVVHADLHPQICEAIRTHRRLLFEYGGHPRIVEPYCHGRNHQGTELLRAIQVNGREEGRGFGKLWTVAKLGVVELGDQFEPNDPNYNPKDSALTFIHCCV